MIYDLWFMIYDLWFMIYDNSVNVWIYVNTLNTDKNNIETYDIYKQYYNIQNKYIFILIKSYKE